MLSRDNIDVLVMIYVARWRPHRSRRRMKLKRHSIDSRQVRK